MAETSQPPAEELVDETDGGEQRGGLLRIVVGIIALLGVAVLVAAVILVTTLPDARKVDTNILEAVDQANKLYERSQKLMANIVFIDTSSGTVAPFSDDLVTRPEQITLPGSLAPNPKALGDVNKAIGHLRDALKNNPRASKDVEALAHKLLSRTLAMKGHYYFAESLSHRTDARTSLNFARRAVDIMRTQMAFIKYYDGLAAMTNDDIKAMHANARTRAGELNDKKVIVSRKIIDLSDQIERMRVASAELAAKARVARSRSRQTRGEKGVDLLEEALGYEWQMKGLADQISKTQDQLVVLVGEKDDLIVRLTAAEEQAKDAKAMLDNREVEMTHRLAERDQCRTLLAESEKHADQMMDKILQLCAEAKSDEAAAAEAYKAADSELGAAEAGEPRKYAEAHADKADVAIAMANLSLERLLLQQRLERFADTVAELWPKLSPPRKVPPKVSKLAGYVEGVAKLRSDAAAGYRDATSLYDTAIRSADRIHEWVYQGRLAAAHLGLYRLTKSPDELDSAREIIEQALEDKRASPYLDAIVRLEAQLKAEGAAPTTGPATGSAEGP